MNIAVGRGEAGARCPLCRRNKSLQWSGLAWPITNDAGLRFILAPYSDRAGNSCGTDEELHRAAG